MSDPQDRPSWLPLFECLNRPTPGSASGVDESQKPLPPWPVDETEFNARLPDGGHDRRMAAERQQQPGGAAGGGEASEGRGELQEITAAPLTPEQRAEVKRVETATEEGRSAIARGGWVCGKCFSPMPYRARSVCDVCRTLRHDMETTVKGWRSDAESWICGLCCEFNFLQDERCRCCATERSLCKELRFVHHESVADEVKRAAVGSVINVRNRVCRWVCAACEEVNSLKCSRCRNCRHERFGLTLSCPTCQSPQSLNNKLMYGSERQDERHYTQTFAVHNFFPRLAPTRTCTRCEGPLHGATITSLRRAAWLCACGNANTGSQMSCLRCRLPRSIPAGGPLLRRLLSQETSLCGGGGLRRSAWDFVGCTNWLCDNCDNGDNGGDGVNKASHFMVSLTTSHGGGGMRGGGGQTLRGDGSISNKVARMVHGDGRCRGCGAPWHHQRLRSGDSQCWRCACHMINEAASTECASCGLPAVDGIRVDVLSQWTKGDWMCAECGRHNYRDRVRCDCGQLRLR